jgi:hypothetical protein
MSISYGVDEIFITFSGKENDGCHEDAGSTMYNLDTNSVVKNSAGEINNIKTANRYSETVAELKYFGTTVTNQYLINVEIKSRLKWGNACYYSAQNLLPSRLLSRNIKIEI